MGEFSAIPLIYCYLQKLPIFCRRFSQYFGSDQLAFDQPVFYREVGLRVQFIRKRRDKTQQEVADELGISRASYANIEAGRQRVSLDLIWKLGIILNAPIHDFVPEPVKPNVPAREWSIGAASAGSNAVPILLAIDKTTKKG